MDNKNPYIISVDETISFTNHMEDTEGEFPLEFSKNRMWTDSFEESSEQEESEKERDNSVKEGYTKLSEQIGELHNLTQEIRQLLNQVFNL